LVAGFNVNILLSSVAFNTPNIFQESEINNIEFYDSERFFKRCAVCRRPEAKKLVLQGSSWSFESKKRV